MALASIHSRHWSWSTRSASTSQCSPWMPLASFWSIMSCLLNPSRMALHNLNGYTAAALARLPEHVACRPPIVHEPPRPLHLLPKDFNTAGALDIHRVPFLIGEPSTDLWPYWHWSPWVTSTPSRCRTSLMHLSSQDEAVAGCSCRKYLPASTWALYNLQTNSMCMVAFLSSCSTISGSLRC